MAEPLAGAGGGERKSVGLVRIANPWAPAAWALAAFLVYRLLDAIGTAVLMLAVGLFFACILDRPIRYLDRRWFSRGLSVAVIVLGVLVIGGLTIAVSLKPLVEQVRDIVEHAPRYSRAIESRVQRITGRYPYLERQLNDADVGRVLSTAGQRIAGQLGRFSVGVAGALLAAVIVTVISLYAVAEPKSLVRGVVMAAPPAKRRLVLRTIVGIVAQFQAWARATLWLMLIVGLACGLGLWVLGVRWALLFGVLAGIGEAVPTIGPILTAIPPAMVAFADEPMRAVWVLVLFLVVQQLEQHLLVPRVMAAALRLHPVSVLFFVVALGGMLGPLGVLLATPLCAAIKVAFRELRADAARAERLERRRETVE